MYPKSIVDLFGRVPVGTKVTVVDQPIKVGWIGDQLYIEANVSTEQSIEMEEMARIDAPELTEDELDMLVKKAGADKDRLNWPLIRKAVRERAGYPIAIARRSGTTDPSSVQSQSVVEEHNRTAVSTSSERSSGFYSEERDVYVEPRPEPRALTTSQDLPRQISPQQNSKPIELKPSQLSVSEQRVLNDADNFYQDPRGSRDRTNGITRREDYVPQGYQVPVDKSLEVSQTPSLSGSYNQ